jgi:tyrosinase
MRRLSTVVVAMVLVVAGAAACGSNKSKSSSPVLEVRKNVKDLTAKEKAAFVTAVLKLKATPSKTNPGISMYDDFVKTHLDAFSCSRRWNNAGAAHNSPLFLPWHRELLLKYEQALRSVSHDKSIVLPYWDWTDPASTAAVFAPNFMGPDGDPSAQYAVTSGPFAKGKWKLNVLDPIEPQKALLGSNNIVPEQDFLVRRFGILVSKSDSLPTTNDVNAALGVGQYDTPGYDAQAPAQISFRCNLEGWRNADPPDCIPSTADPAGFMNVDTAPGSPHDLHNGVHLYVGGLWAEPSGALAGGTMLYDTSPNDPVFFLHHANVDRIWSQWEAQHPTLTYSPQSGAAQGWNGTDTMWPWHDMTIDSLQSIAARGYKYSA